MVVGQRIVADTGKRICKWPNYVALVHLLLCEVDEVYPESELEGLFYLEHQRLCVYFGGKDFLACSTVVQSRSNDVQYI